MGNDFLPTAFVRAGVRAEPELALGRSRCGTRTVRLCRRSHDPRPGQLRPQPAAIPPPGADASGPAGPAGRHWQSDRGGSVSASPARAAANDAATADIHDGQLAAVAAT